MKCKEMCSVQCENECVWIKSSVVRVLYFSSLLVIVPSKMTILLIVIITFGFCYLSLASRVAETFRKNKIVPDILYKSPQEGIQVIEIN